MSLDQKGGLSIAQSAELLRAVLPKMSTFADGYDPNSYSIWYEYVRGGKPALQEELEPFIAARKRLTAAETQGIFDRHLRDASEALFVSARKELLEIVAKLHTTIATAESNSDTFDDALGAFEGAIIASDSVDGIRTHLAEVLARTSSMRDSMKAVGGELRSKSAEVGRLTAELDQLRIDVLTDPLSGLVNRRGLDLAIARTVAAAEGGEGPFSLVMVDIDHFKKVNDAHGHLVGDEVLRQVAALLKSCVRGGDTAARYGGEEFAVLLPATLRGGAQTVAEYIRTALRRVKVRVPKSGAEVGPVTVSCGVAEFVIGEDVARCIERADRALYEAKNGGRNRVTLG